MTNWIFIDKVHIGGGLHAIDMTFLKGLKTVVNMSIVFLVS